MAGKRASTTLNSKVTAKEIHAVSGKPRTRKARLSKVEAERLASFKALMEKNAGKCTFAGFDA